MKQSDLIPPDKEQCQAEKPNGHSFMTLGGSPGMERCKAVPVVIVTEKKPDADGVTGSMSLCLDCWKVFWKQLGADFAEAKPIIRYGKK